VVEMLSQLCSNAEQFDGDGRDGFFNAEQNALVARNAERYYRAMIHPGPDSWNIRDRHMVETLERLVDHYGADSKAIVWEHNTHIGDARFTDMASAGMVNVGQLVRQHFGEEGVVLVGFGSHRGSVIAGRNWGAPMERMEVPPARAGSWEDIFHAALERDGCLIFTGEEPEEVLEMRGHRAIGVVYRPEAEQGNYVPTRLPDRYDAYLYIDQSSALNPLHIPVEEEPGDLPETYPTAV
jgi:erythromycin esterase